MKQGPNVRKLIASKIATDIIPPGTDDGLAAAVGFLSSATRIKAAAQAAAAWVEQALALVKADMSPDNKWGDDDEAIAGEILRQIKERKGKRI